MNITFETLEQNIDDFIKCFYEEYEIFILTKFIKDKELKYHYFSKCLNIRGDYFKNLDDFFKIIASKKMFFENKKLTMLKSVLEKNKFIFFNKNDFMEIICNDFQEKDNYFLYNKKLFIRKFYKNSCLYILKNDVSSIYYLDKIKIAIKDKIKFVYGQGNYPHLQDDMICINPIFFDMNMTYRNLKFLLENLEIINIDNCYDKQEVLEYFENLQKQNLLEKKGCII